MDENLIITYSPKYKAYQQRIRSRQIERAEMIINSPCKKQQTFSSERIKVDDTIDAYFENILQHECNMKKENPT